MTATNVPSGGWVMWAEQLPDTRQDTQHRLLPGDGVFDLVGVIEVLHRIGALTWVGPEVISPELAAATSPDAPPRRPRPAIDWPSQR